MTEGLAIMKSISYKHLPPIHGFRIWEGWRGRLCISPPIFEIMDHLLHRSIDHHGFTGQRPTITAVWEMRREFDRIHGTMFAY